jgi:hypothetical protein
VSRENRVTRVELRTELMIATGLAREHLAEWNRELLHTYPHIRQLAP